MIAVQMNKKEEFDRLWKWAKTYMYQTEGGYKGYFAWHCKTDGTQLAANPASDGEVWFITALFFADGRWGAGWNGVGAVEYLGVEGQGISGLVLAPGYQPAGASQLQAQLVGIAALCLVACLLPWAIFRGAVWLRDAAQGAQQQRLARAAEQTAEAAEMSAGAEPVEEAPPAEEAQAIEDAPPDGEG